MTTSTLKIGDQVEVIQHPNHPSKRPALIGKKGHIEQLIGDTEAIVRFGPLAHQWWRLDIAQLKAKPTKPEVFYGIDYGNKAEHLGEIRLRNPAQNFTNTEVVGQEINERYIVQKVEPTDYQAMLNQLD